MTRPINPTPRQLEFLRFLADYMRTHRMAPVTREILDFLGATSPKSAIDHLQRLVDRGLIVEAIPRTPQGYRGARAILLTRAGWEAVGLEPPLLIAPADDPPPTATHSTVEHLFLAVDNNLRQRDTSIVDPDAIMRALQKFAEPDPFLQFPPWHRATIFLCPEHLEALHEQSVTGDELAAGLDLRPFLGFPVWQVADSALCVACSKQRDRFVWERCPCCLEEFYCNLHHAHTAECDCPEIDALPYDPYTTLVSQARKVATP